MSIEQYQRTVNNLDKEIATLEQKKASFDKKAADQEKRQQVFQLAEMLLPLR